MPKRILLLTTTLTLAACSSTTASTSGSGSSTTGATTSAGTTASAGAGSGGAGTGTGAGAGGATGTGGGSTAPQEFTVTWGPITLMPGEENTQCVVMALKNATAIHVGAIHNVLSEGSHHLIVYQSDGHDATDRRPSTASPSRTRSIPRRADR